MGTEKSLNISEEFTGTGVLDIAGQGQSPQARDGTFNMSVSGTFVGTVELQRDFERDDVWRTVGAPITAPIQNTGTNSGHNVRYRFECTAFTSGTIIVNATQ